MASRDYRLLWSVSDDMPTWNKEIAYNDVFNKLFIPKNPIAPNPINVDIDKYIEPVKPTRSLGGRHTRRGAGYVSLSNYNNLP